MQPKSKPVVFVSGPFRHADVRQMAAHVLTAQHAAHLLERMGLRAYCPHVTLGSHYGNISEGLAEQFNLEILRLCDALYVLPGAAQSVGTQVEIERARLLGLPRLHNPAEVREWQRR